MGKHTFKEWMIAVRAWSFPASAMPVIVSTAYVYWKFRNGAGAVDGFVLWPAIAALVLMVLLHAAGNTWSEGNHGHIHSNHLRRHHRRNSPDHRDRTAPAVDRSGRIGLQFP